MRKVFIFVFIILVISLGGILYISSQRVAYEEYYSIPQARSYVYHTDETMRFEVYTNSSNPFIQYESLNQYVITYGTNRYTLENVEIDLVRQDSIYLILLTCSCIKPVLEEFYADISLEIINAKYTVRIELGSLSILNPEHYTLLNVDSLYATYGYMNQTLYLVGINLSLNQKYQRLNHFKVGSVGIGDLAIAKPNEFLPNEINIMEYIPKYSSSVSTVNPLTLESNVYFIPIAYSNLILIKEGYITMELDGQMYYIDTFNFIVNDLDYDSYKTIRKEGEIVYA